MAAKSSNIRLLISIHALREEGDLAARSLPLTPAYFYPRPPRGGRPGIGLPAGDRDGISIHALREEGDVILPVALPIVHISIHALREEGDWWAQAICWVPV